MSFDDLNKLGEGQDQSLNRSLRESDVDSKVLVNLRKGKRQSATKTLKKVFSGGLTLVECEFCLDKLNALLKELQILDNKLNSYMLQENLIEASEFIKISEVDDKYADDIRYAIADLTEQIKVFRNPTPANPPTDPNQSPSNNAVIHNYHKISLPNLQFPSFDGKPANYNKFIVSFESLLSKYELSSFEKYSFLSKQLSGPAKKLIESLSLTDLSYESAKKLLDEAFSDKLTQQYSVIEQLCNLKLDKSAADGFSWISEARILNEQVISLGISSEIFTQYFLWSSLCDDFKREVIAITNKSKPSLSDIMDNLFDANNRFLQNKSKKIPKATTMTNAVSVLPDNPNPIFCPLCKKDGVSDIYHKLKDCRRYDSPTDKVQKLRDMGGCVKCGATYHVTKFCKFKFRKACGRCNNYHMYFLCSNQGESKKMDADTRKNDSSKPNLPKKDNPKPEKSKSDKSKDFSNNTAVCYSEANAFNDVVLPTATVFVNDKPLRVFKDLGSQATLVNKPPSEIPNSKIVTKLTTRVRGINASKTYHDTHIVDFPVKVPGQGEQMLRAVCVDSIDTKIFAPGWFTV